MPNAPTDLAAALQGRYRFERELGEGGTATVYLADDLRHSRKVALKVLKPELAAVVGAERFLAEVKTTASLQHPHILPLFDSGEAGGFLYHVTPHVAGESLRARLSREGQLPIDEAVTIASDVAAALDYAHRNGVVHRDIKPENLLFQDGHPVVADFGIALAIGAGSGSRLTETGISVGTPHYMSPEQATGDQHVGPPADIYALGCVLYEMLAGEPPFTGSTPQAILGKIVLGKPTPLREQRPSVPEHVAGAVSRALEKVPADRFRTGADFGRALQDASFRWPLAPAVRRPARPLAWTGAVGGVAVLTVLGLRSMMGVATTAEPSPRVALSFSLPDDQLLAQGNPSTLEISPDGVRIAYVADRAGRRSIFVRELDGFEVRAINGTEGATSLFFSPDGQRIGFHADGELRSVAVGGGIPARIASVSTEPIGVSWGEDGTILYALGAGTSSVWRVDATGGPSTEISLVIDTAYAREHPELPLPPRWATSWPRHLPSSDLALVVPSFQSSIGVVDLSTGRFRPVVAGNRPYYLPSGHIVFYSGPEEVSVVPFDLERQEATGPAVVVADDVLRPAGSEGRFSLSRAGTLVYARGGFARRVVLVERNGRETLVNVELRGYRFPAVSPDGRWIAVTVDPQPPQIWMIDLSSERAQPISTGGYHLYPVWLRDGSRLAFNTNPGIAAVDWPSSGTVTQIRESGGMVDDWPLSDRMLVRPLPGGMDISWLDLATNSITPWIESPVVELHPRTSEDGLWVAYVSDVSGAREVYVRGFGRQGPDVLVSRGGGVEPVWASDGTEIYYRNGNAILAVSVRTTPRFDVVGSPQILFSGDFDFANDRNWDALPDGRFAMIRSSSAVGREIRVLSNWLN